MAGSDAKPTLAEAVTWLSHCEALPRDVEAKARLLLLDTFGCLLAGLLHPRSVNSDRPCVSPFRARPRGRRRTSGSARPAPRRWAQPPPAGTKPAKAMRHRTAGRDCRSSPRCWRLPRRERQQLGDLLVALTTGYEIGARAGEAWRIPAGWHVDGGWHSLAVAAAVARMTAGPERIQPAIEAAACQIPASLYLPIAMGSVLRNTYPAHAVLLGMMAAAAADAGFEMPHGALEEGRRRVLQATAAATARRPVNGRSSTAISSPTPPCATRITASKPPCGLRKDANVFAAEIDAIKLKIYPEAVQYCGNRAPRTAIQAQFSLSYAIAAALVLGDLGPERLCRRRPIRPSRAWKARDRRGQSKPSSARRAN